MYLYMNVRERERESARARQKESARARDRETESRRERSRACEIARDGEDMAITMLAVVAMPPFRCYIDCQGTLDCFKGGAAVGAAADNPRAHLWGRLFTAFEGEDVAAFKTKAHATMADVHAERTTL